MASQSEIDRRRRMVEDLWNRGMTQISIAKMLNVSKNTINNDIAWAKARNRRLVTHHDKNQTIGDALRHYSDLEQKAVLQFHESDDGTPQKGGFLQLAGKFREMQLRLQQQVGLLPSDGNKNKEDSFKLTGGVNPKDVSLEELKKIAEQGMFEIMRKMNVPKEKLKDIIKDYAGKLPNSELVAQVLSTPQDSGNVDESPIPAK